MAKYSPAVERARTRSIARAGRDLVRIESFVEQVANRLDLGVHKRLTTAVAFLKTKTVKNISQPVTKTVSPQGNIVVTDRSKPGEFPKADTTLLMTTIMSGVKRDGSAWLGFVGTPVDYGVILELRMQRPFLVRTLTEEAGTISRIMRRPIRLGNKTT